MTLYCIRQKSTGFYLPAPMSGHRSYNGVKPTPLSQSMPRFFSQVKYARITLCCWLRGVVTKRYTPSFFTKEVTVYAPQEDRVASDFDIVPVYVTISTLSVDDIADIDKADADVKQRIKDLGLVHHRGGK